MTTEVEIQDEARLHGAIADVRSDSSPVNWVLASHVDGNPILVSCVGSGTGGPSEMAQSISDSDVMYALVRLEEQVDTSYTVKFVYIHWVGEKVSFVKLGKFGVVHGSIQRLFQPVHTDIDTRNKEDLTEEAIMRRLKADSGSVQKP